MVKASYYLIDSSRPGLPKLATVNQAQSHRIIRTATAPHLVAFSDRALKKAIASGWW